MKGWNVRDCLPASDIRFCNLVQILMKEYTKEKEKNKKAKTERYLFSDLFPIRTLPS